MTVLRPDAAFVFAHPAHFVAFGFGAGLARVAPGTIGTLLAFPLYWLIGRADASLAVLGATLLFFLVGVWACELTGRHLGVADHGAMVWDEVVAFLLVLAIVPDEPAWQAAAFVLFRAFDIAKPWPIQKLERRWKNGFGVMFDDLLAAGYALLALAIAKRILL